MSTYSESGSFLMRETATCGNPDKMTPPTRGARARISRPNYTYKKDGVDFWRRNRPASNYVEKRLDVRLECRVRKSCAAATNFRCLPRVSCF